MRLSAFFIGIFHWTCRQKAPLIYQLFLGSLVSYFRVFLQFSLFVLVLSLSFVGPKSAPTKWIQLVGTLSGRFFFSFPRRSHPNNCIALWNVIPSSKRHTFAASSLKMAESLSKIESKMQGFMCVILCIVCFFFVKDKYKRNTKTEMIYPKPLRCHVSEHPNRFYPT